MNQIEDSKIDAKYDSLYCVVAVQRQLLRNGIEQSIGKNVTTFEIIPANENFRFFLNVCFPAKFRNNRRAEPFLRTRAAIYLENTFHASKHGQTDLI